jgi:hypothetical protein
MPPSPTCVRASQTPGRKTGGTTKWGFVIQIYRITKSPEVGDIVDSVDALESFAQEHGPGRYDFDEHSLDPFPGTKVTARAWGKLIHHKDGQVVMDPIAW